MDICSVVYFILYEIIGCYIYIQVKFITSKSLCSHIHNLHTLNTNEEFSLCKSYFFLKNCTLINLMLRYETLNNKIIKILKIKESSDLDLIP